ncbi:anthrone oxygenase family protein [Rathayibacter sp. CAU 1779]
MIPALAVITGTVVGLMAGVEFAVAFVFNPIMTALPIGPSIEARAHGGRMLGRAMPFWYFGSLILAVLLAVFTWGTAAAASALIGAALLAVSVIMSITLLVPINNRSKTWTADEHPADWREQYRRWDGLHYARVAVVVAGFVLVLVAGVVL